MTSVKFLVDEKGLYGFCVKGHSSKNSGDETGKIVCAAVSSACYMAANTITEVIGDEASAVVDDALMEFKVLNPTDSSVKVLEGLKLHLKELSGQYSNNITIFGGAK
ncbi:MAG: ribosomal-processing cysteine protease Prp [Clostridia bacterium]|nr:ribosomal-processing cysteine protease Prp [Clostridia bacterium]